MSPKINSLRMTEEILELERAAHATQEIGPSGQMARVNQLNVALGIIRSLQSDRARLEEALKRIANAPGASVWDGQEELRRQLQAVHDYASVALIPLKEKETQ